jgi:long-chain acyl-CoA synthetase
MTGPFYPGAHCAEHPDKPAVVMAGSGEQLTFSSLDRTAHEIALALRELGLQVQDHVTVWMENRLEFLQVAWGAHYAGLNYTFLSTRLTPDEAAYIVSDSGARVLIVSAGIDGEPVARTRELVGDELTVVVVGGESNGRPALSDLAAKHAGERLADPLEGSDLTYSSGTTGRPKGVLRPFTGQPLGTTLVPGRMGKAFLGMGPDTVYLSPAPMYHTAPLRWSMDVIALGGTAVILEKFDPEATLAAIERFQVTHAQFVPTMFHRLLRLPPEVRTRYSLDSLRAVVHAAAPCPREVKAAMLDWWGPIIHEYYGGTEGAGLCWVTPQEWLARPGTVGRAVLGRVEIVGPDGAVRGPGEDGLVYFAEGNSFSYHNDPDKTAQAVRSDGASTMGDIGHLDDEGYLFLTDRASNMIITGGVNVYPQEAENLLVTHPKVADAAVIGVPNPEFGEEVKAVVQVGPDVEPSPALAEELIAFCRASLADIKCPRSVDFRPELPREPTGKLLKRLIRDEYWAAQDSRI